MNPIKFFTATRLVVTSTCCVVLIGTNCALQQPAKASEPNGFAVVELFTSEGCSSCPPADELVGKIQHEYKDKPVYLLAYHVDYWDRMGWKDAYSSAVYTERQSEYSRLLGSQLYTPQAIVNGQTEFVGSDEPTLRNTLIKTISGKSAAGLIITPKKLEGSLTVNYSVTGNYNSAVIRLALVQKNATRQIKRGENQGRILNHWQIVRALTSAKVSPKGNGKLQLSMPEDFNKNDWEIIAMIQNTSTGKMYAATKLSLQKQN